MSRGDVPPALFPPFMLSAVELTATWALCEICPIAERHVSPARAVGGDGRRREVLLLLDSCRTASQKATTCYKFSLKRLFAFDFNSRCKIYGPLARRRVEKDGLFSPFSSPPSPLPVRESSGRPSPVWEECENIPPA